MPVFPPEGTILKIEGGSQLYVITEHAGNDQRVVAHFPYMQNPIEGEGTACSDYIQRNVLRVHSPLTIMDLLPPRVR